MEMDTKRNVPVSVPTTVLCSGQRAWLLRHDQKEVRV